MANRKPKKIKSTKLLHPDLITYIKQKNRLESPLKILMSLENAQRKFGVDRNDLLSGFANLSDSTRDYFQAEEDAEQATAEIKSEQLDKKKSKIKRYLDIADPVKKAKYYKDNHLHPLDVAAFLSAQKSESQREIFLREEEISKKESYEEIYGNGEPNHFLDENDSDFEKDKVVHSSVKGINKTARNNFIASIVGVELPKSEPEPEEDDDEIGRAANHMWEDDYEEI